MATATIGGRPPLPPFTRESAIHKVRLAEDGWIIAVPAYAQQEQHDQQEEQKAKPAQDEKKAQSEKSAKPGDRNVQQEEKNTQQQDRNKNQEEKSAQQQDKNNQQENRNAQQRSQPSEPAQQAQRGNAGRIPDDRYRANFGQEHRFRVSQSDYSNRRFQYGGYLFGFVDAWPSNWLYTQDVFVVEIDGVYYLCNASCPGVNVELSLTPWRPIRFAVGRIKLTYYRRESNFCDSCPSFSGSDQQSWRSRVSEEAFHGSLWPRPCGPIHPAFWLLLPSLNSIDH